ncbi:FAD-binding protein [Desulfobulbus rhabdoformis]|uniref:FAD-binding oxidoreductase n=1 Tax=Desulfobulbus rhabdoformis TaxID=34032 RepID=UPI00196641E1|nr:FAD-linked oxidase C-terminal domain-containing protein [Desulfobulbus rhabdoformis]MBM9613910.1 FAD-binding protein [Desulfobulbus rhabdoformis]
MLNQDILDKLEKIVGSSRVSWQQVDLVTHSFDATQRQCMPDVVVHPTTTQEVSQIVKLANEEKIPILPRGAGSGFTGGSLPVRGGIVLVLTRMNRIIEIDTDNLVAVVEPGVVTAHLQRKVEQLGLFYPPDPASKDFSTLGGNVAECAGGPRCVKYGVTRDYVMGLTVVTPTGDIIQTGGRAIKNVVGYDLTRLIVGAEGTLGVVTEIILRLIPQPEARKTMLVAFTSIEGAAEGVSTIIRGKVIPTTLEFIDNSALSCIRQAGGDLGLPEHTQAVLIIEVDGASDQLDPQVARIEELLAPLGVLEIRVAATQEESEAIWKVRRAISPSLRQLNPHKFNEDIVVPRSRVPEMIRALEKISAHYNVPIVNFGHAGDGNIHVNVMVNLDEQGMRETVEKVLKEIFETTVALQGSVSGEHGIGTAKQPYIAIELSPETLGTMRAIKKALDPHNIMNPGKIFPELNPESPLPLLENSAV